MVGVGASDDRAKHDGLVGLVLEVAVPELVELRSHGLQLLLSWTNLEASIDSVRREASLLRRNFPLLEHLLLYLLDATEEVVGGDRLIRDTVD